MKAFFHSFVLLVAIGSALHSQAQTKQEVFKGIENILKRAEGQKIEALGLKALDKVTHQEFTESSVAVYTKNTFKNSKETVTRYSNIPWKEIYKYSISTDRENDKVYAVTIYFDADVRKEYKITESSVAGTTDNTIFIKLYIRTKDFADFDKYMNLLGQAIPNKVK